MRIGMIRALRTELTYILLNTLIFKRLLVMGFCLSINDFVANGTTKQLKNDRINEQMFYYKQDFFYDVNYSKKSSTPMIKQAIRNEIEIIARPWRANFFKFENLFC